MNDIVNSPALQHITAIFAAVSGVCILFFLALFIAWLYVVVDIVRSEFKNNTDKLIWFIFIMIMPPLAVPLYFFIGRHQKIDHKVGDESSHTSVS
jgi:hypothetical protein